MTLRLIGLALACAALLGGCDDDEEDPRAVAEAWVAALNARDWPRACELSVAPPNCVRLLRSKPFGEGLRVEGFGLEEKGQAVAVFAVSSARDRRPRAGWTAYAPLTGFAVERDDGDLRVHWEYSVIE